MVLREEIEKLTPRMRRYARALLPHSIEGRIELADEIVREAILRSLSGERTRESTLRMDLYTALTQIRQSRVKDHHAPSQGGSRSQGATEALDALGSEEREALLLVVLEGFTYSQAADILNIPRAVVVARIARARQSLGEHLDAAWPYESRARGRHPQHLRVVK